jgi:hypothetical protein
MKKALVLLLLVTGQLSCQEITGGDCNFPAQPFYDIQSISLQNWQIISDSSVSYPEVEAFNTTQPIAFTKLLIRLAADVKYYAVTASPKPFSFMSAAYACSPPNPGYKGTKERVSSIRITSSFDFDAAHPAGSSLNDVFKLQYAGPQRDPLPAMEIDFFLAQDQPTPPEWLNLKLKQKPDNQIQNFQIEYEFTNGEKYTLQSGELLID